MRRRLRDILTSRSDGNAGEATVANPADRTTTAPLDDTAWGLDVLVEGVDAVVEYVPSSCPLCEYQPLSPYFLYSQQLMSCPGSSIVAIHGLNGHREETWTAKNNVNWLRHPNMLPEYIPNARIMSWGYDANTHSTKELSAMYLYDHAQKLVADLSLHRRLDKVKDPAPLQSGHED
jgi:hypothetical protein